MQKHRLNASRILRQIDQEMREARAAQEKLEAAKNVILQYAQPGVELVKPRWRRKKVDWRHTEEGKAKLSAAMKARWRVAKAHGKTNLKG